MITAKEARAITERFATNNPFYTDICEGRKNHRCHRYTIDENLYFEYWAPEEWEFTVAVNFDDPKHKSYVKLATAMATYMHNIRVSYSKVPSLMALCRAKASEIK